MGSAGEPGGAAAGHYVKWHTIEDGPAAVAQDVRRIRQHPLVPGYIPIHGFIYDVATGALVEVPEATEAGRATASLPA